MAEPDKVIIGSPLLFFSSSDGMAAVRLIPAIQAGKVVSYYLQVTDDKGQQAKVNLSPAKLQALYARMGAIVAAKP
jgi:hypothetical protein